MPLALADLASMDIAALLTVAVPALVGAAGGAVVALITASGQRDTSRRAWNAAVLEASTKLQDQLQEEREELAAKITHLEGRVDHLTANAAATAQAVVYVELLMAAWEPPPVMPTPPPAVLRLIHEHAQRAEDN